MPAPEIHPQELESAEFKRQIARAWLRRERLKRWSYRLGYFCGRCALHWRNLCALFSSLVTRHSSLN